MLSKRYSAIIVSVFAILFVFAGDALADLNVSGTSVQNYSGADVPAPDWSYWQSVADYTVNGNKTFKKNKTFSGIWYITGNVTIKQNVTINGTIIARGNVIFNRQNITINAQGSNPAVISDGNVEVTSNRKNITLNGFVVSTGNFTMGEKARMTVNGGISAEGNVETDEKNHLYVNHDPNRAPNTGFLGGVGGGVGLSRSTWREVY